MTPTAPVGMGLIQRAGSDHMEREVNFDRVFLGEIAVHRGSVAGFPS